MRRPTVAVLAVFLIAMTGLAASLAAASDDRAVLSRPDAAQPWRVTCPESATLLARRSPTDPWVEVNRLSLLHGSTDLMPGVVTGVCDDTAVYEIRQVRLSSPTLLAPDGNETRLSPPFAFREVYLGDRLTGQDLTVEIVLGALSEPETTTALRRRVITMDASLPDSSGVGHGRRPEEATSATAIPADTLEIQAIVRNTDGTYVLDRTPGDFRIKVGPYRATLDEELTRDERTGLPLRDPTTGRLQSFLPFFSPAEPADRRPPLRFLVMLDLGSWIEDDVEPILPSRYQEFVDEAVLAGLRATAAHVQRAADRYPSVELVLIRYGTGVQLFSTPVRLNDGLADAQTAAIRQFLLRPPESDWRPGESNLQLALDSMKALWHFHDGKRGAIAITARRQHIDRPRPSSTFPPSVFETEAVTRSRYEAVLASIRDGFPLVATLSLEHLQRRSPIVYALGLPRNATDYMLLAEETELQGGFTVPIGEPGRKPVVTIGVEDAVDLGTGLRRIIDDLDRAYLFRVRVKNLAQTRQTLRAQVTLPGSGLHVRAQEFYVASQERCTLMPAYLSTRLDDTIRLAAAATASDCWESDDVATALQARLVGPQAETRVEIQDELLRSYGEIMLRRVQAGRGRRRRRAVEQLLSLDMNQLRPEVARRHGAQVASWQRLAAALGRR